MSSMAEMITGYPLFRGRDNADQLVQIMKIVGTPSNETLAQIKHDSVRSDQDIRDGGLTNSPRSRSRQPSLDIQSSRCTLSSPRHLVMVSSSFRTVEQADNPAISLLEGLLQFEPNRRYDAHQALTHPYFTSGPIAPPTIPNTVSSSTSSLALPPRVAARASQASAAVQAQQQQQLQQQALQQQQQQLAHAQAQIQMQQQQQMQQPGYGANGQQDMARLSAEQQQYYAQQRDQMARDQQRFANGKYFRLF